MDLRDRTAPIRFAGYPREHHWVMRQMLASLWAYDIDMEVTLGLKAEILK